MASKAPAGFSPGDELSFTDVLQALELCRVQSLDELRKTLGASKSQKYFLLDDEIQVDAKLVIQLAWNLKNPSSQIAATDFRGDLRHVALPLRRLGFDVIEVEKGRQFGEIENFPPGSTFANRRDLSKAGVHRPTQAGICGDGRTGAESIVVSGGYVDDEDFGHTIIYTGQGGNDPASGRQVADQELLRGNLALAFSCDQQIPVRLIRGSGGDPSFSPTSGYRYDGLFTVNRYWPDKGRDGFKIWRYELRELPIAPTTRRQDQSLSAPDGDPEPAPRRQRSTWTAIRNARVAEWVKRTHNWTCQFCAERISTPAGAYAEAAHIRPIGSPHFGTDHSSNLLCLCPNCHKRFDSLAIFINNDKTIIGIDGAPVGVMRFRAEHFIDDSNFDYHRRLCLQIMDSNIFKDLGSASIRVEPAGDEGEIHEGRPR